MSKLIDYGVRVPQSGSVYEKEFPDRHLNAGITHYINIVLGYLNETFVGKQGVLGLPKDEAVKCVELDTNKTRISWLTYTVIGEEGTTVRLAHQRSNQLVYLDEGVAQEAYSLPRFLRVSASADWYTPVKSFVSLNKQTKSDKGYHIERKEGEEPVLKRTFIEAGSGATRTRSIPISPSDLAEIRELLVKYEVLEGARNAELEAELNQGS